MSDFSNITSIKSIRKDRHCFLCLRKTEAGNHMNKWTGRYEGSFFSDYICDTCEKLTHIIDDYGDGFSQGDTLEYMDSHGVKTPEDLLEKLRSVGTCK